MQQVGAGTPCTSIGIYSPDGEYLPLLGPVVTGGRPEEWLNCVEEAMFATTKKHLFRVLEDSKGERRGWLFCCVAGRGV
jgi:dynein heavy chain